MSVVGEVALECENSALMRSNYRKAFTVSLLAGLLMFAASLLNATGGDGRAYLPMIGRSPKSVVEVRGLWVTRFEVGTEIDDNTSGTVKLRNVSFEVNGEVRASRLAQ